MNNLGLKLKLWRQKRGMTQEELAIQLNVSKATISLYENNKRIPPLPKLIQMCEIFDVPINELTSEEEPEKDYCYF